MRTIGYVDSQRRQPTSATWYVPLSERKQPTSLLGIAVLVLLGAASGLACDTSTDAPQPEPETAVVSSTATPGPSRDDSASSQRMYTHDMDGVAVELQGIDAGDADTVHVRWRYTNRTMRSGF